jgi:hypothetical protein
MKKPLPKPRNPVAKELRNPKFRSRVVQSKKKVIPRKRKHK